MRSKIALVAFLPCFLLISCVSNSFVNGEPDRGKDPRDPSKVMHLYRMDIDQAAVKKGARLLFNEPPPRFERGQQRRAKGFFSVSDAGFCRIEVGCAEPIVGLNGRQSWQAYQMLKFFGRIAEDGSRATTTAGEKSNVQSTRGYDEVRFIERGNDKITVQPYLNGKPMAYRYHFHHASIGSSNVRVPWK